MLGNAEVIDVVRSWLEKVRPAVVVLDPVMVATSGDRLLQESAEAALRALLPLADLITPNLAELAILVGEPQARDWADALEQGKRLAAATGATILVKGGHLDGDACPDALVNAGGLLSRPVVEVAGDRIPTRNSHGTGCSLSSAMATAQARLGDWEASLRHVKPWLAGALQASGQLEVGAGNGPIHHFHHLQQPLAAGEFAAALRQAAAPDLEAIYGLEFIRGLAAGTLAENSSPTTSPRTPSTSTAIHGCLPAPVRWRRQKPSSCSGPGRPSNAWKSNRSCTATGSAPAPWSTSLGPVTKSYVDHLLAASASGSYGVLVAALLPCFWLYAEVGKTLHAQFLEAGAPAAHPYAEWLRTYADEDFAQATREAIAMVDDADGRRPGTSGRRWLRRSSTRAVSKWSSSTRRACTPERLKAQQPVR